MFEEWKSDDEARAAADRIIIDSEKKDREQKIKIIRITCILIAAIVIAGIVSKIFHAGPMVAWIIIDIVCIVLNIKIAEEKGKSIVGWIIFSLFFPVIAVIVNLLTERKLR